MKIALISDLHANLPALEAVLDDLKNQTIDRFWVMGDLIGYGPHPVEIIQWLMKNEDCIDWVIGNHDAMLVRKLAKDDLAEVNREPLKVIDLTRLKLQDSPEEYAFCSREFNESRISPKRLIVDSTEYILIHASRGRPLSRYIYPWHTDILLPEEFRNMRLSRNGYSRQMVQCFGHTHVPTLVKERHNAVLSEIESIFIIPGETYALDSPMALVNPGSVGQPRDLNPHASYAILNTTERSIQFRRVRYDQQRTLRALNQWYASLDEGDLIIIDNLKRRLLDAPPDETPEAWLAHYKKVREICFENA